MPDPDYLHARQHLQTLYFHHWRKGNRPPHAATVFPLPAIRFQIPQRWPGFRPLQPVLPRTPRRIRRAWDARGPSSREQIATEAARRLEEGMGGAGLRFVKVLGWGGLGVAGLFETAEGGKVVCKMDLKDMGRGRGVDGEGEMHIRTAGAKHVVQRVVLHDRRAIRRANRANQRAAAAAAGEEVKVPDHDFSDFEMVDSDEVMEDLEMGAKEKLDLDPQVLFIEYMSRGRLDDFIGRAGEAKNRFPDKVLWRIFECLFRGVVGMAYPDAFQPVGCNPRTENTPQVTELCADCPVLTAHCSRETMIHFDLDPLNVLVGDHDQGEHSTVPLIKIADLGLAKIFDRELREDAMAMWVLRKNGKNDILTPEQFSQEWDHVKDTPWAANTNVAGNFNWWTNMYQVALIMFSLITLHRPEYPPIVENLALTHPDGSVSEEWTYGGYLLNDRFSATSATLRHLVALCLADNPHRRPGMHLLDETIQQHAHRHGDDGSDVEMYDYETDEDGTDDDDGTVEDPTGEELQAKEFAAMMFGAPPPPEEVKEVGKEEDKQKEWPLKGPEGEDAYWERRQAEEDERVREVNRIVGIRRAPRMKILVDRWAPGFVADLIV